ncbi:unnamed protein product [Trichobilharzia regenti]|nr:unnamed protein product [Trichobilharzia regenti]
MYNDQPDYELCSSHINQLPVHEFYSTGRVLIIELDGIITTGILEGKQKFLGLFEFIDKGKCVFGNETTWAGRGGNLVHGSFETIGSSGYQSDVEPTKL